jgi:hypothetical protein
MWGIRDMQGTRPSLNLTQSRGFLRHAPVKLDAPAAFDIANLCKSITFFVYSSDF